MSNCSHQRSHTAYVKKYDDWHDEYYYEYETTTESTTVDIDTHRYKCTQCGKVMYYSGRAREYYEEGKKFDWINGLDK